MKITGCRLSVSIPEGLDNSVTRFQQGKAGKRLVGNSAYCFEDEKSLIKRLNKVDRVRYAASGRVPAEVFKAAAETGFYIARAAVAMEAASNCCSIICNKVFVITITGMVTWVPGRCSIKKNFRHVKLIDDVNLIIKGNT